MDKNDFFATFTEPKSDQKEIVSLIERYGEDATLKEILEDIESKSIYRRYKYKCPKCEGKGYLVKEYNGYPSGLPDSGWVYEAAYDYRKCDLCNGLGYTEKEYKPKTVTTVIGYE